MFTSDGRLLKLLARPVDRGTTWGYTRSLLIIFFRRRDFADAIRCNIKNKPSLVILFCANTSCAIWTNRWRSFLFPRVSVSLSLRRGAPLPTAPPLHCTPPPIRRTAHPISHLLCWFFAARETFPNTNRAYGVYRLFTRHNARLSPLFRCITGFNYTKQGPERSHHGLWTRLGDIDMRYQGLLYGRTDSVANPTPVCRISHAFDKVFLLASTKLNNSLAKLSKQVMRIVNFLYCNHNSKVYSFFFQRNSVYFMNVRK